MNRSLEEYVYRKYFLICLLIFIKAEEETLFTLIQGFNEQNSCENTFVI